MRKGAPDSARLRSRKDGKATYNDNKRWKNER
jgi:hypothetical protein